MPQGLVAYLPVIFMATAYSVAMTAASGLMSGGQTRSKDTVSGSGHLVTGQSTQDPIRLIYGTHKSGGTRVFIEGSGLSGEKYYERIHIVQTWGEGEMDSLSELYFDDKLASNFAGWYYHEFYPGTPTQGVCQSLKNYFPDWADAMRDTAYSYLRIFYNPALFTSLPEVRAVLKGLKVYDPRTGLTAWSDNPGCCLYDLHLKSRYGIGLGAEWWDEEWVIDFCNWCDAKGYKMNACLYSREMALDTVAKLMASFRALPPIWSDGVFGLSGLDYETPVLDLTEDDIVDGSFRFGVPDVSDFPTSVQVKYFNKDNNYILEDLKKPNKSAVDFLGDEVTREIQLTGCSDFEQASKVLAYELDRSQLDKYFNFVAGIKALPLEQGNLIRVTHSLPGWVNHVVRVETKQDLPEGEIALTVKEETEELYDDDIDLSIRSAVSTNLPDPLAIPPPPSDITFSEESYAIKDNSYNRIKISWAPPVNYPFLDYVEVWASNDDGGNYFHKTDASGSCTIEPVRDGEVWYFKLRSVSINGRKASLAELSAYEYTVIGKVDLPENVTGFQGSAAGDTVLLRWNPVPMDDLAGYEIRLGASWAAGIFVGFTKSQSLSLVGVKPGTHSFVVKAKDTLGMYSETGAVASVTVFNPPNYTQKASNASSFSDGTHNNSERYNDPIHGYVLRVDHDGGLEGDWLSPTYDLGQKKKCRHWLEFIWNSQMSGMEWENLLTPGEPWEDLLTPGLTWLQLFGEVQAGTVQIKFQYSDDGSSWNDIDYFQILSCEVDARYVRVHIFLQDKDPGSYLTIEPVTLKSFYWE